MCAEMGNEISGLETGAYGADREARHREKTFWPVTTGADEVVLDRAGSRFVTTEVSLVEVQRAQLFRGLEAHVRPEAKQQLHVCLRQLCGFCASEAYEVGVSGPDHERTCMVALEQVEQAICCLDELRASPFVTFAKGSLGEALLALQLGVTKLYCPEQVPLQIGG